MIKHAIKWLVGLTAAVSSARAADLVTLSPQTWDRYAPAGKEADAIYGDFVLANDKIVAVIGNPIRGRHANMTVREVGGAIIDLTLRDRPNDQLSAFYPGAQLRQLRFAGIDVEAPEVYEASALDRVFVRAKRVTLRLVATPHEGQPDVTVAYTLEDGWNAIEVTTQFTNKSEKALDVDLVDSIRADRTFERSPDGVTDVFWAYDKHFGQAYGVDVPDGSISVEAGRAVLLKYRDAAGKVARRLAPGESTSLTRRVYPAIDLFGIRRIRAAVTGAPMITRSLGVVGPNGENVGIIDVVHERDGKPVSWGRITDSERLFVSVGEASGSLKIFAQGYQQKMPLALDAINDYLTLFETLDRTGGQVLVSVRDENGQDLPHKIQFIGRDGTPSPDFGPDSGEHHVRNVYYGYRYGQKDDGLYQDLRAGVYDVVVSRGPEYDAVIQTVEVESGMQARVNEVLVRSVKTNGWISADFHSHSSPSGDNTASQFGRVLNLLCEHIEFAPCTEHNRLSSYDAHLKRLGAERLMATCVGMELTGGPLPLNHQNAFPLVLREHTQDGGGPTTDLDPETQIERLALWDGGSEKLVQVNHPDMGWMFFDRNGDGTVDDGFAGMVGRMDVIEVHPPHFIFEKPMVESGGKSYNNSMHNWLQLLNQGKRIPGVVNTDAHYNFHGSGWLRNYIKSPTDNPAEIKTIDIVRAAEAGHIVMSSGPFLEVALRHDSEAKEAIPGDSVRVDGPKVSLHVKVQCPNWFDVDRVQVFLNGKPVESLNFTRKSTPDQFSNETVRFDQEIEFELTGDAHVIVATIGEKGLGPVMGPDHANDPPVAVSNPIFVDVDGDGFKPNGDVLGGLPTKGGR